MPVHIFGETLTYTNDKLLERTVQSTGDLAAAFINSQRKLLRNQQTQSLTMEELFEDLMKKNITLHEEKKILSIMKDQTTLELQRIKLKERMTKEEL
jgi:hypothetical protein